MLGVRDVFGVRVGLFGTELYSLNECYGWGLGFRTEGKWTKGKPNSNRKKGKQINGKPGPAA